MLNKQNILFNILVVSFFLIISSIKINAQVDPFAYKKNPNYEQEIELYKISTLKQADIIMLGNSLTHGANWNELLGRFSVVEQGIVSDVLKGFAARTQYVYRLNPKIVFILGGLNDIFNWVPVEEIYKDYVKIIEGLKARNITPVIQSTLYSGINWGKDYLAKNNPEIDAAEYNAGRNKEVDKLNELLENYAKKNNIEFLDMNQKTRRGNYLKNEITRDGVHLNAKGYKLWAIEIDKVLKKYNL